MTANKLVALPAITNRNALLENGALEELLDALPILVNTTDRWIKNQKIEDLYMMAESEELAEMYDEFVEENLVS